MELILHYDNGIMLIYIDELHYMTRILLSYQNSVMLN